LKVVVISELVERCFSKVYQRVKKVEPASLSYAKGRSVGKNTIT